MSLPKCPHDLSLQIAFHPQEGGWSSWPCWGALTGLSGECEGSWQGLKNWRQAVAPEGWALPWKGTRVLRRIGGARGIDRRIGAIPGIVSRAKQERAGHSPRKGVWLGFNIGTRSCDYRASLGPGGSCGGGTHNGNVWPCNAEIESRTETRYNQHSHQPRDRRGPWGKWRLFKNRWKSHSVSRALRSEVIIIIFTVK